jgi:hypothetical protein
LKPTDILCGPPHELKLQTVAPAPALTSLGMKMLAVHCDVTSCTEPDRGPLYIHENRSPYSCHEAGGRLQLRNMCHQIPLASLVHDSSSDWYPWEYGFAVGALRWQHVLQQNRRLRTLWLRSLSHRLSVRSLPYLSLLTPLISLSFHLLRCSSKEKRSCLCTESVTTTWRNSSTYSYPRHCTQLSYQLHA